MYLLFCFQCYHPGGGWNDYQGMHETIRDAKLAAEALPWWEVDVAQIVEVELDELGIVATGRRVSHHEETRIKWS